MNQGPSSLFSFAVFKETELRKGRLAHEKNVQEGKRLEAYFFVLLRILRSMLR